MRGFLIVVVALALGFLYYKQKHNEQAQTAAVKATTTQTVAANRPTAVQVQPPQNAAPAQAQQPSGPNWMKRSLDRAREVRDQSAGQTRKSQDP